MKTNKIWILFWLLFFSATGLQAKDFKFGALGGLDIANSRWTNKPDFTGDSHIFNPMLSFNINGFIGYRSNGRFGLSAEPGFIRKGGRASENLGNYRLELNYIQMPLLTDWYLTDKWMISIGPEFAYLIKAVAKSKNFSNNITDNYDYKFEVSGLVGVTYSIGKHTDLGVRYNHGITRVLETTWTDMSGIQTGVSREYNQYFQFLLTFKI